MATNLFIERGFHKTSIRDIARACPFNLAALYMYVGSKEDILYLVAQQLVSEIVRELQPAALTDLDPGQALESAFATYCRVVSRFSRQIRLLYREIESLPRKARDPIIESVQSLTQILEGLLERAIKAGEIREVDTRLVALDMMVVAHMWALHGRLLRSHITLEAFILQQSELLFSGLRPPAASGSATSNRAKVPPAARPAKSRTLAKPAAKSAAKNTPAARAPRTKSR